MLINSSWFPWVVVFVVQSLSHIWLSATPRTAACQSSLSFTISQSLLKLMSVKFVMPSAISSSVVPFSAYLQSFPASGSFPVSQPFASGDQSIGTSASASVLPMNIQDWFPLGWTGLISLQSKGLSRVLQHHSSKASVLQHSAFLMVQLSHLYTTTGKTIALTRQTFIGKVMSLLSTLVINFLPRSKHLLIPWLQVTILQWFWSPRKSVGSECHRMK